MALLAAYIEVLAAWSSDPKFVVNIPLFEREAFHSDVARLVGDFTGSILLGVDTSGQLSFVDRARRIQARFRSDASNSGYSGLCVLRDLARVQSDAAQTAASVVFTSALGLGDFFGKEVPQQFGRLTWMISQTSQVWLDCQVTELGGGLLINWDSVQQLLREGVLEAMFQAFVRILNWLIEGDSDWSRPVPEMIPREQLLVRERINSNRRAHKGGLLHDSFFLQARQGPERIAIAWGNLGTMTYDELARRARSLAQALTERGIKPGDLVAITMPKCPGQIVSVLAILYAGAAYLPIGIDQPENRRARLYAHAGVRLIVTDRTHRSTLKWPTGIDLLTLEEGCFGAEQKAPALIAPTALAYVIFTSGSTGDPKGVMVPHRAAMNTIEDIIHRFEIGPEDRVLSVSSLDFDWSVADIFELLSVGGTVVLPNETERRDVERWAELIKLWGVTLWQSVPALFDMLLNTTSEKELTSLRMIMLGGDLIGINLYKRLKQKLPKCRFVGLGGITETAIHITLHEITEIESHWRSVPYGLPLTNVKCRVADARGRDCPDWVTGELWVGGDGLAAGYLGDVELTKLKFVEYAKELWYRTGDLARYWPDGKLEFLGRSDSQVEILGHRIELGEIQATLEQHPSVAQAFVTTLDVPERRLAAAVVDRGESIRSDQLRSFLADRLPRYMIPAQILVLDALPLTINSKIDAAEIRRRVVETSPSSRDLDPPADDTERTLASIWSELLGVSNIARSDSFFALGGDSLMATRLGLRLRNAGIEGFQLRRLFAAPELRHVASTLRLNGRSVPERPLAADPDGGGEPFPLTEMQRAYWIGRQPGFLLGGVGSYWYWEFDGADVNLDRLEEALNRVIQRHPMLRAVVDDQGRQQVLAHTPRLEISVAEADPNAENSALVELRASMSHRVHDPKRWPLFEVRALRYGDRTRTGFGFDYIFVDALSIMIVFSELATLYDDPKARLPDIGVSYRDYVIGAREDGAALRAAERYWSLKLAHLPPAPRLPLAKNPAEISAPRFCRRQARVCGPEWLVISARARTHGLTASTILATAFAEVLCAWSAQTDLTLNFTLFDRKQVHPDINRIVGDFTSLMLIAYSHTPEQGWNDAAHQLQEQVGLGLENSAVSGLSVMRRLTQQTGRPSVEMPIVFTSMLGVADDLIELSTPFGDYAGGLSQTPQVWLDNQVAQHGDDLLINWDSVDDLFPDGMLDAMFESYLELLRWLAAPDSDWHASVPLPLPKSQHLVRARVNAPVSAYPNAGRLLHDGFFAHAARYPERPALAWGTDNQLTYGDVADQALRVAAYLLAEGLRTGDAAAVMLPKGPDQVIAVIGILAAGGVYVPIGVDQPPERRKQMLAGANVRLVLNDLAVAFKATPLNAPISVSADSAAYVIYTSGSTGEPKGVTIAHRAALNTIEHINSRFKVSHTDRTLADSALDFDLSVYDLFGLLSVGGSVIMITETARHDPATWRKLVQRWNVTIWNSVPVLLEMLLSDESKTPLTPSLRVALVSGDWIPLNLRDRLHTSAPDCRLVALGGATEASIWSIMFEVTEVSTRWRSIPYGYPLRNQKFRVVNAWGGDCPDWTPGELWIGGAGLALGYAGDQNTTTPKFVDHEGERWFRTGDLGRYWPDGTLEFLGRIDDQVKIRGYRVEYGEIEAALESHPDVDRAIATTIGERQALAAAVILREPALFDFAKLTSYLLKRLPHYMMPQRMVELERLPLKANGKVDRSAVALVVSQQPEMTEDQQVPLGPTEEAIAELWKELLQVSHIERNKSFFAMGGDSLLAIRFVDHARRRFRFDLCLRQMLDAPTIQQLADMLDRPPRDFDSGDMEKGVI
jgi:amino acid adenylation domain-containing protein